MKKTLSVILAAAFAACTASVTAFAEEASAEVYVSIADGNGKLALAQEKITVTDIDNNGALTIDDALFAAHEAKYDGGAAAGYLSTDGEFGRMLNMLWGTDNGGSYGYCLNNTSAMSLGDTVKNGDYINAYCFTDLTAWSDTYCYFDANTVSVSEGGEISLTLLAAGYDENFAPITLPAEGAVITLNGEKTDFITDSEGKVSVSIPEAGSYVISAVSDTQNLVPPVCTAVVEKSANVSAGNNVSDDKASPETGAESAAAFAGIMLAAAGAVMCAKKNEK